MDKVLVQSVFDFLSEQSKSLVDYRYYINAHSIESFKEKEYDDAVNYLEKKGLVKVVGTSPYKHSIKKLPDFSEAQSKGLFDWIDSQDSKKIGKEKNDEIEAQNLQLKNTLLKWQKKVFWWVFIFGLGGFLLGVYNLIISLEQEENLIKNQQPLLEAQKEQSKPRTLTLDQKSLDSLHSPNDDRKELNPEQKKTDSLKN